MKKYIVPLLIIGIVIGLLVGVISVYESKQTIKQQQAATSALDAKVAASNAAAEQTKALEAKDTTINTLRAECTKGYQLYALLTAAQQKTVQRPVCTEPAN